jgi:hypothetical protein
MQARNVMLKTDGRDSRWVKWMDGEHFEHFVVDKLMHAAVSAMTCTQYKYLYRYRFMRHRRGFIAKVADFGLSVKMDSGQTHLSNIYQVCDAGLPERHHVSIRLPLSETD